ncbi:MAG: GNAT family N-acetyltransferase, partial [bacterium]
MKDNVFHIWRADDPADHEQWVAFWESWPQREIFSHPDYLRLESDEKSTPLCAALQCGSGRVLYAFFLRNLGEEPYWSHPPAKDIISPYGWGGPCFWGEGEVASEKLAQEFWPQFEAWAAEQNIVSEYISFTLFSETVLPYPGEKIERAQHVVRNLNLDEQGLWMDVDHKVRKNVKKARRSGVCIETHLDGGGFDDFYRVFHGTMDRRQGRIYSPAYFEQIHRRLTDNFIYFHALHEGRVVSTELVLFSHENAYSFLGGTDNTAFSMRPNDLLKYEIILWAQKRGFRRFILGGGNGTNDGIFRYKQALLNTFRQITQNPRQALRELAAYFSARQQVALLDAEIQRGRETLLQKTTSFILQVSDFLRIDVLSKQESFRVLKKTLNFSPERIDLARLKHDAFLDYYLCESHLECHRGHLRVDDYFVKVMTLKE